MKICDLILLDLSLIIVPLMIYLLYAAYKKYLNKKEDNLIFIITIFSQIYLISNYGISLYKGMPLFIVNMPLLISYYKKSNELIFVSTIYSIIYYYIFYNNYLIFIIFEYILCNLIYYKNIKNMKTSMFLLIFSGIITIFNITFHHNITFELLSEGSLLYITSFFIIYMLEKGEDMLKLHLTIKEIKHDETINKSLFQITHEIKNPIAVCKGYLDMYDKNKDFKIPILKEEIDRTLILLEDFLAMNKLKISKDIIDINLLLEEVTKNMDMLFTKNNIETFFNIPQDELYINADYNRLMQVFVNILKNSVEALENKRNAKIKLWTKIDNKNIHIYIKDNGVGIKNDELKKIKEPFYTTKQKGTGLGVSLSNEIINAHFGKLEYESKENKYTLVTVILPLEKAI